jgi:hypothetical protein
MSYFSDGRRWLDVLKQQQATPHNIQSIDHPRRWNSLLSLHRRYFSGVIVEITLHSINYVLSTILENKR